MGRKGRYAGNGDYSYSMTFNTRSMPVDGEARPRIFRVYYPKSKRSYWRVSPMPAVLTTTQQTQWNAAYKFREQLNAKRAICDHCGKEL